MTAGAVIAAGPGAFADRLARALERSGSAACVGLDPVYERLPAEVTSGATSPAAAIESFCMGVIEAVAPHVGVVKPQSACFERHGWAGVAALTRVCRAAHEAGLLVLLDAKRGDIGVTAEHYAAATAGLPADALTVNAYLGPATVEPYLKAGLGVFVLVRTSNPDSDAVQSHPLADGRTVAEMMADQVAALGESRVGTSGYSDVGAVVGATKAADGRALRERMPRQVFLVPGYGAQGGTADDVRALLDARGGGVLVNASRSVIYAPASGGDWRAGVREAAARFVQELASIR